MERKRARRKQVGHVGRTLGIGVGVVAVAASSFAAPAEARTASASTTSPPVALGYDALTDGGSLSMISRIVGAQSMWERGYTGKGVDVAVIDTGVARVPGLDRAGKVIDGPDLSFDSQNAAFAHKDAFGHGTMMASIIAGSDVAPGTSTKGCTTCLVSSAYSDTTKFVGIAPEARIVNVKAGASDGAVDVTQVIAAIDWVVQHRHDNGMNIRVINLSYGTDSVQPAAVDPLAYAAEVAWRNGIVVVAAAGNDGRSTTSLADPAYNPNILAVGAEDDKSTVAVDDDSIPKFAQHGNSTRTVDVVAPGTHVIGLSVPGSFVDTVIGTGKVGTRFQRGSGTSESTAVVSGVVALLLQKFPTATPDQIKAILNSTAQDIRSVDDVPPALQPLMEIFLKWWQGNGVVDADAAGSLAAAPIVVPSAPYSTGLGLIEGSRGTAHVVSGTVALVGEQDIMGSPWDGVRWSTSALAGKSWTGGVWNGVRWSGAGWTNGVWDGATWTGTDWAGVRWSGVRWSGMTWDGVRWAGTGWDGVRWSGSGWDGVRWSTSSND